MKYSSTAISGLLEAVKNTDDVAGFACTNQSISSSGVVPVWGSFAWYYQEDRKYWYQCEDPPALACQAEDTCW